MQVCPGSHADRASAAANVRSYRFLAFLAFFAGRFLGAFFAALFFAGFTTFFVVFLAIFFFAAAFFGLAGAGPEGTTARAGASPETGVGGGAFALAATA